MMPGISILFDKKIHHVLDKNCSKKEEKGGRAFVFFGKHCTYMCLTSYHQFLRCFRPYIIHTHTFQISFVNL